MVIGPKEKGVNNNLKKTSVRVRPFPGAIVKQLHYYNIPTILDVTPDTIFIEGVRDYQIPNILPNLLEVY